MVAVRFKDGSTATVDGGVWQHPDPRILEYLENLTELWVSGQELSEDTGALDPDRLLADHAIAIFGGSVIGG